MIIDYEHAHMHACMALTPGTPPSPCVVGAGKQCHKSCSCDLCSGPSESQCQGMCLGNGSDHDAMVMTTMALMCMVTTILAIFISLYLTDRCGLRLRYFTQLVHFGIEETERHRRTSAVDGFASDLSQMRYRCCARGGGGGA